MNKPTILRQIDNLIKNCKDCPIRLESLERRGRGATAAIKHCRTSCQTGVEMLKLGDALCELSTQRRVKHAN